MKPAHSPQQKKQYRVFFILFFVYFASANATNQGMCWSIDIRKGSEFVANEYGAERVDALQDLQQLMSDLKGAAYLTQVHAVNDFFHSQLIYKSDQEIHGLEDFWTTPFETLAQGAGDCEDYAIAKYAILRSLGVPSNNLRLIYVRARIGGPNSRITQAHMVLGYYPDENAQPLILDSLIRQILPASERDDLTPVFSFNSDGLWAGHAGSRANSSPTSRLSRWRNVLGRMQEQGINWENASCH